MMSLEYAGRLELAQQLITSEVQTHIYKYFKIIRQFATHLNLASETLFSTITLAQSLKP